MNPADETIADDPGAGKLTSQLTLPRSAVLLSISRGGEVIIPRGDTRLRPGDVVTTLTETKSAPLIRELLESKLVSKRRSEE